MATRTTPPDRAVINAPAARDLTREAGDLRPQPMEELPSDAISWEPAASLTDYTTVEQAIDLLIARGVRADHLRISGEGVRLVEDVTGTVTYWAVIGRGAFTGGLLGLLFGIGFAFLGLTDPIVSTVHVVAAAAAVAAFAGAVVSSIGRWVEEGRRDFLSTRRLDATSYTIHCAAEQADAARRTLAPMLANSNGRLL